MFPTITILGRTFGMYGVMALIGILAAGFFICIKAGRRGLDTNKLITALLIALVGVFVGSSILYAITNLNKVSVFSDVTDFKSFLNAFITIFGGSVFYGGLIGGLISGYIVFRKTKMDYAEYADITAVGVPLMHGFARIGCFLGGCCYGIPSKFGFTFTNSLAASANGVSRFPVQLLEAGCEFIIFGILWYLYEKKKLKGSLLSLFLIIYPIMRFCNEFLRGDLIRGFVGPFSTSQFISIFVFIFGVISFIYTRKRAKKSNTGEKSNEQII